MKEVFNMRRDRKNRSRAQITTIVLCLMLAMAIAIGGTVAWLIDKTEPVEDTFTFGDVNINLVKDSDKSDWKNGATLTEGIYKISERNGKKLVPGDTFTFDPTVEIVAGSEKCYVFVKLEAAGNYAQIFENGFDLATGWELVDGQTNVYCVTVDTSNVDQYKRIFATNTLTVGSGVTKTTLNTATPTLKITAYAVQFDNVSDPVQAWSYANP